MAVAAAAKNDCEKRMLGYGIRVVQSSISEVGVY